MQQAYNRHRNSRGQNETMHLAYTYTHAHSPRYFSSCCIVLPPVNKIRAFKNLETFILSQSLETFFVSKSRDFFFVSKSRDLPIETFETTFLFNRYVLKLAKAKKITNKY